MKGIIMDRFWGLLESIIRWFVSIFCKLRRKEYKQSYTDNLMQFVKFGIVGVSNTAISYVSYLIALVVLRKINVFINIDYLIAQAFSFLTGTIWSFYWNNRFVFQGDKNISMIHSFIRVLLTYSFSGLFLSSALLVFWVNIIHVSEYIAPILNLLITVPLNFILNKLWAFPTKNKK